MPEEKKKKALWVDEDTHHQVSIMAATRKLSIKQCLKELVEEAKHKRSDQIHTIYKSGVHYDVSKEKGPIDFNNIKKYPVIKNN